jgi:hypothetical protein
MRPAAFGVMVSLVLCASAAHAGRTRASPLTQVVAFFNERSGLLEHWIWPSIALCVWMVVYAYSASSRPVGECGDATDR